jgi:hypothetical protein
MRSVISILSIVLFVCFSCSQEDRPVKQPSLDDFKTSLKSDMTYSSIVKTFGEPSKDIGSGIHIYVYALPDATEIWIGYTDKIVYARQIDEQGTVLHRIL